MSVAAISIELEALLLKAAERLVPFSFDAVTFHVEIENGNSIFTFSKQVLAQIIRPSFEENREQWEDQIYGRCFASMSFTENGTIMVRDMLPDECIYGIYYLVAYYLKKFRVTQRLRGEQDGIMVKIPRTVCLLK